VERQKLMAKGLWRGTLKDTDDLSAVNIPEGHQVLLMGTAERVEAPEVKTVFVEDMTSDEKARAGAVAPAGMVNLGNTCYMNSTLQCLRYVPELREALRASPPGANFSRALAETFAMLDASSEPVPPVRFVNLLRTTFPNFAAQGSRGGYMQQDAEELYNAVSETLAAQLPASGTRSGNSWDAIFGIQMEETWECAEADEEPPVVRSDRARKLVCNIQGGAASAVQVNHLHEGLRLGLEGTVEKRSEVLGRDASWTRRTRIAGLPRYLCVHMMRFYWKATPDSREHSGVKCKIVRPVSFPETLDLFEFCTDKLQAALRRNRARADRGIGGGDGDGDGDAEAKAPEGNKRPREEDGEAAAGSGGAAEGSEKMAVEGEEDEDAAALRAALAMSLEGAPEAAAAAPAAGDGEAKGEEEPEEEPVDLGEGIPADFTGMYELFGVVTHKGRGADSGHYIGWVRQEGEEWACFDDAQVSETSTSTALDLKGGDKHTAYLLFFRFKPTAA